MSPRAVRWIAYAFSQLALATSYWSAREFHRDVWRQRVADAAADVMILVLSVVGFVGLLAIAIHRDQAR